MPLSQYHKKRDFNKTPEPKGKITADHHNLYIIQKHAASHLHYDFRIELEGVLKSWAVPKGPSLDPTVKRLAMHVEDHPIEYGNFEGIIPKGEYGGGAVMLWDKGVWTPIDENPHEAYKKGHLRFALHAEKLNGRWYLIRFKDDKHWFLIKYQDDFARAKDDYDITLRQNKSTSNPFRTDPPRFKNALWVHPKLICEVEFTEWTKEGHLRHPSFKGLRTDKKPSQVIREKEVSLDEVSFISTASKKTKKQFFISHPNKILYPEDNISKHDLLNYYETVCDSILPYISLRPLTLVRCPSDYSHCFYQRHFNATSPEALHSIEVRTGDKTEEYIYLNDRDGLLSLIQMGVLEIQPWGSRINHLEQPDMIIFDLDPALDVPWKKVVAAAVEIKEHLIQLKLRSFVKSTGGKGLHVVIPIKPEYDWEEVKEFTHVFVQSLEKLKPGEYISNMNKTKRKGKIFIDYLRNQRTATAIGAYSTRARQGAPVSAPLFWEELGENIEENSYNIKTMPDRLNQLKEDPWKDFWKIKQSLPLDQFKDE